MRYQRILVKISGEALANGGFGVSNEGVSNVAKEIAEVVADGAQVGVVVGGGNFWRGRSSENMDRGIADNIGMLATVMNGLALSDALRQIGVKNKVVSAVNVDKIARSATIAEVHALFDEGYTVIFVGGTGAPYFSTDTAVVLRACEAHAQAVFCAKAVDGIYDSDPNVNKNAVKYDELSYDKVLADNLKAMDATAIALARDFAIEIVAYGKNEPHGLKRILNGEKLGTVVKNLK